MSENKTRTQRRSDKTEKKGSGSMLDNIRWGAVIAFGLLFIVLMFVLAFGIRACSARLMRDEPVMLHPTATPPAAQAD